MPTPKQMSAKPMTPARPTPASSSEPTRATNAVDARVIVENETIETVMGKARRRSARPGCFAQGRSGDNKDGADMEALVTTRRRLEEPENDIGLRGFSWSPRRVRKIFALLQRQKTRLPRATSMQTQETCVDIVQNDWIHGITEGTSRGSTLPNCPRPVNNSLGNDLRPRSVDRPRDERFAPRPKPYV